MSAPRSLMFAAGEASGDGHAAALITALRAQAPDLEIFGAGGPLMQAAGMDLHVDLTQHAVVGLVEVAKHYFEFRRIFFDLLAEVERRRPVAVVLVDNPGFNLRFARVVKERIPSTKVFYYISPQVWAWHASRAKQIERDVDLMLTIFPFEKDWYATRAPKLRVEFVGHPFADRLAVDRQTTVRDPRLVLLLPGSREKEVEKIFPVLAGAVDQMPGDWKFVAAAVDEKTAALMRHSRVEVKLGGAHAMMQQAALAIAASGTATMECAYFGCPMVVVYRLNWLTYLIGRMVVRVKWLAMPNLIAGREILPEYLQADCRPDVVARTALDLLTNDTRRETMKSDLAAVVRSLGGPGASERAAKLIATEI